MVSRLGRRLSQGRAGPAEPESRPHLQLILQLWCICLALRWSLQTFLKARDAPLPFPEGSLRVQGPKAQDVRMAAESGWPASRSTSWLGRRWRGRCFLSWAPTLAEGWGSERKQARGQNRGGFPGLGFGHTQVTLQCPFNLLRTFLSLCDLCNTNELWAINDGFKASRLGVVNYGWRGGGRETQWEQANGQARISWEGP